MKTKIKYINNFFTIILYLFFIFSINISNQVYSNSFLKWEYENIVYFNNKNNVLKKIIKEIPTPVFVTDKSILQNKVYEINNIFKNSLPKNKFLLFYAIKANFNPQIVSILKNSGINGIETVSPYEILLAKKIGFQPKQILFTGNNLTNEEINFAKKLGVIINIGSILELQYFAKNNPNSELSIRINPGFGDGEFNNVITGGNNSKFGILHKDINKAFNIIKKNNLKVIGIHCHLGSGLYKTNYFNNMVKYMFNLGSKINNLQFIDIGGGFGVRYKPFDKKINLKLFSAIVKKYYNKYKLNNKIIIEPGKYLVSESTFLLTKITNIKNINGKKIVAVNTGFNHIIRPALYSSYHHVINISNIKSKKEIIKLVGNICESTDVLGYNIKISKPKKSDILAILTTGAYCSSMSSLYNLRPYANEVIIDKNNFYITRKVLNFKEIISSLGYNNN